MMAEQDQIQIGDYADIISDKSYRYYVVKIEPKIVTLMKIDEDLNQKTILIDDIYQRAILIGDIYQIENFTEIHTVIFSKNATDIRYFERDYTQKPTKIHITSYKTPHWGESFLELENGIIIYEDGDILGCADISNIHCDKAKIFLEIKIFEHTGIHHTILHDNTFIIKSKSKYFVKFNLKDFIVEIVEDFFYYDFAHCLKDKKLLCCLKDGSMYLFDLITKQKITIDDTIFKSMESYPYMLELMNNNLLLQYQVGNIVEFHRIDINNGNSQKIASLDHAAIMIGKLHDDKLLLFTSDFHNTFSIEMFDLNNRKLTSIFTGVSEKTICNIPIADLSPNDDVLFKLSGEFYLFNHITQEITLLPLFYENTSHENEHLAFRILKNGNVLINNGSDLIILEFPLNQKELNRQNYDKMNSMSLNQDIKKLIREYL